MDHRADFRVVLRDLGVRAVVLAQFEAAVDQTEFRDDAAFAQAPA